MEEPQTLAEIKQLMQNSTPLGLSFAEFGRQIGWGLGSDDARHRRDTILRFEIDNLGLSLEQALGWLVAYKAVMKITPENPSAAGRVELMERIIEFLQED